MCLPLLPRNTSTLFTEMNAPLWERTRLASSTIPEDRFTVELREIRADYFPISVVDFEFLFRRVTFVREFLDNFLDLRLKVKLILDDIRELKRRSRSIGGN